MIIWKQLLNLKMSVSVMDDVNNFEYTEGVQNGRVK